MKGIVYKEVGSPNLLKVSELKKPIPKDNQVLIKVKASSISILEYMRFVKPVEQGRPSFSFRLIDSVILGSEGKVLGNDIAGVVEEIGNSVKRYKKGDEVFGLTTGIFGGWAEYALAGEDTVCLKPAHLTFKEASAIASSGVTALGAVKAANIREGCQVLVHGASGGVGQYVVQLAKAFGGVVTAVCSTRNLEMVRSIGADFTIDYKREDFTKCGKFFDAIIAINGYNTLRTYKMLLNDGGSYIVVGGAKQALMGMFGGPFYSIGSGKKFSAVAYPKMPKQEYLTILEEYAEAGKIILLLTRFILYTKYQRRSDILLITTRKGKWLSM